MYKIVNLLFIIIAAFTLSIEHAEAQRKRHRQLTHADSSIIKTEAPASPEDIVIKYGMASYYAQKFNGRKTSTGTTYNSLLLTAACNVLPLGTWVKVTNVKNDKSVIVKITDHMHYKNRRLIDVTRAAAQKLDFISSGITKVKVEVLGKLPRKRKK